MTKFNSKFMDVAGAHSHTLYELFDFQAAIKDSVTAGKQHLGSKAHHYHGNGTDLHWRRHKAVVDHDGCWQDTDIPSDVRAPVIEGIDVPWILQGLVLLNCHFVPGKGRGHY